MFFEKSEKIDFCTCPFCGSKNLEYGELNFVIDSLYQEVECRECEATFDMRYDFAGIVTYDE